MYGRRDRRAMPHPVAGVIRIVADECNTRRDRAYVRMPRRDAAVDDGDANSLAGQVAQRRAVDRQHALRSVVNVRTVVSRALPRDNVRPSTRALAKLMAS